MTEQTLAAGETESSITQSQVKEPQTKTYTQEEVDNLMAKAKGNLEQKFARKYSAYEELGSLDEIRQLKEQADKLKTKKLMEKGEFETILSDVVSKKDSEIARRDQIIKEYKVNTPLINAAAKYKSVNPEQVRDLLMRNVRLNEEGEVEVVGQDGQVRYSDSGNPYGVDDLVREFLDSNPHFRQATPSTTNTSSNIANKNTGELDITKLDMSNPEHRKRYAEYRKKHGIA